MKNPTPTVTPAASDLDAERRAEAERIEANLLKLLTALRQSSAEDREGLDEARREQARVLDFVDELFNQRGFEFIHADDTTATCALLQDAMQTALLLVSQSYHADDEEWARFESTAEELGYALQDAVIYRRELDAYGRQLEAERTGRR